MGTANKEKTSPSILEWVFQLLFVVILTTLITKIWDRLSYNTGGRILRSWILISLPFIVLSFISLELFVLEGSFKAPHNLCIHLFGLLLFFVMPIYLICREQTYKRFIWGIIAAILAFVTVLVGYTGYEQGGFRTLEFELNKLVQFNNFSTLQNSKLTLSILAVFLFSALICYGIPYIFYKVEHIKQVNILSKWKAEKSGNNARFASIATYRKYPSSFKRR